MKFQFQGPRALDLEVLCGSAFFLQLEQKKKKTCDGRAGWGDKILVCHAFAWQKQKETLPDFCPRSDICVTVVWRKQSLMWVTTG